MTSCIVRFVVGEPLSGVSTGVSDVGASYALVDLG